MDLKEAMLAVSDPATPPSDLADIAYSFPDLRTQVAVHKAAYPGLLDWLDGLGDPDVSHAVASRRSTEGISEPSSKGQSSSPRAAEIDGKTPDETVLRSTPVKPEETLQSAREQPYSPMSETPIISPIAGAQVPGSAVQGVPTPAAVLPGIPHPSWTPATPSRPLPDPIMQQKQPQTSSGRWHAAGLVSLAMYVLLDTLVWGVLSSNLQILYQPHFARCVAISIILVVPLAIALIAAPPQARKKLGAVWFVVYCLLVISYCVEDYITAQTSGYMVWNPIVNPAFYAAFSACAVGMWLTLRGRRSVAYLWLLLIALLGFISYSWLFSRIYAQIFDLTLSFWFSEFVPTLIEAIMVGGVAAIAVGTTKGTVRDPQSSVLPGQQYGYVGSAQSLPMPSEAPVADAKSTGFAVLGFFIPLVGLILFLTWRDQTPLKARSAGMGALVGVIVGVVSTITMYIVILLVFQNMETF